jgi:hypothetical protein
VADYFDSNDEVTEEHVDAEVFEVLWCLFCGNQSFVENRYDGVYCAGCGASVRVQRWRTVLMAIFGEDTTEFVPPDGDLREPASSPVFVEIEETDTGYEVGHMDCWGDSEKEEIDEPKQPTEFVRENDDGSTVPYIRWGNKDTEE